MLGVTPPQKKKNLWGIKSPLADPFSYFLMLLSISIGEIVQVRNTHAAFSCGFNFSSNLNDRTRNNGAKLIVKHFNTSVAQHFYRIKITTNWNALPSAVVSSRTVNSFKNSLDKHWAENPPNVRVNW